MNTRAEIARRDDARLRSALRIEHLDSARLGATKPHGTRMRYLSGCKCVPCRAANSNYETSRAAARRSGDWNGIVSAATARAHIKALSHSGVGRRALAAASDVSATIIQEIRRGKRVNIRKRTETRILAVDAQACSDHAVVIAAPAWKQIRELKREGFSAAELARRMGMGTGAIQFGRKKMIARNVAMVDKFYRKVMAE